MKIGMQTSNMKAGNSSKNSIARPYAAVFLNLRTANPIIPAV
jgi:hypothetical protein